MPDAASAKMRLASLDALRGLNIAAMVVFHYSLIYFPVEVDLITAAIHFVGNRVAALFLFLSGAGAWLFLRHGAPATLFKRGIFLFALTTLVSVFPKRHYYLEWTVIQVIGGAFILLAVIAHFTPHRFIIGLGMYITTGIIAFVFQIDFPGVFPFFPHVLSFICGYGFAALCPMMPNDHRITRQVALACLVGLVAFVSPLLINLVISHSAWTWYSATWQLNGAFMLLYFLFVWGIGQWKFSNPPAGLLVQIGRVPLSVYYFQQIILRFLQAIQFQVIVIDRLTSYFLLTALVFVLIYILIAFWQRHNFVWSLEWMMRQL